MNISMITIDEKLIILKANLVNGSLKKEEAAKALDISNRQLGRLLKKWEEEGILKYDAGNGRGHSSTVTFYIDVEHYFMYEHLKKLSYYSNEQIERLLALPLSPESKAVINGYTWQLLSSPPVFLNHGFTYEFKVAEIISDYHPLRETNRFSRFILYNTIETLYTLDKLGSVQKHLVVYDEWKEETLYIHLNKQIKFSDGTPLLALDVAHCLNRMVTDENYQAFFEDVISIKAENLYVLSIQMKSANNKIKEQLSNYPAGIYIEQVNGLLGTGPYYVAQTGETWLLKTNRYHFGKLPDISEVLISKGQNYEQDSRIERYAKWLMFAFNPRKLILNSGFRQALIDYLAACQNDEAINHELVERIQSHLKDTSLKITVINIDDDKKEIIRYLEALEIPLQITILSNSQFIMVDVKLLGADIIIKDEVLPQKLDYRLLLRNDRIYDWFNRDVHYSQEITNVNGQSDIASFGDFLINHQWVVPLASKIIQYHYPEKFRYIELSRLGTLDLSSVIIDKE